MWEIGKVNSGMFEWNRKVLFLLTKLMLLFNDIANNEYTRYLVEVRKYI